MTLSHTAVWLVLLAAGSLEVGLAGARVMPARGVQ